MTDHAAHCLNHVAMVKAIVTKMTNVKETWFVEKIIALVVNPVWIVVKVSLSLNHKILNGHLSNDQRHFFKS